MTALLQSPAVDCAFAFPYHTYAMMYYLASTYNKLRTTNEWVCIALTRSQQDGPIFARNSSGSRGVHFVQTSSSPLNFRRYTIYTERQDPARRSLKRKCGNGLHERANDKCDHGYHLIISKHYKEAEGAFKE